MKEKTTKYYLILKSGAKKYFDWTYGGFREAQQYAFDNPNLVQMKDNGCYTLYTEEV